MSRNICVWLDETSPLVQDEVRASITATAAIMILRRPLHPKSFVFLSLVISSTSDMTASEA